MRIQDLDIIDSINTKYEDSFIEYLGKVTAHIEKAYKNKDYKTAAQLFKLILLKEDETRAYKDRDIYSKVTGIHKDINDSLSGEQTEVFKRGYLSNYWNGWNSSDTFSLTLKDNYMISEENVLYIRIKHTNMLKRILDVPDRENEAFEYKFYAYYNIELDNAGIYAIVKMKDNLKNQKWTKTAKLLNELYNTEDRMDIYERLSIYSKTGFIPLMLNKLQFSKTYDAIQEYIEEKLETNDYEYVMDIKGDLVYEVE